MVPDISRSARERLLVCVSPKPESTKLIQSARHVADDLQAEWFAVYVEVSKSLLLSEAEQDQLADNLRLAEQLGGKSITLKGRTVVEEVVRFAQQRNITRIVAGKPKRSR